VLSDAHRSCAWAFQKKPFGKAVSEKKAENGFTTKVFKLITIGVECVDMIVDSRLPS
jgi:hypothetical protein